NCRHGDFQSPALPTELSGHSGLFSDIERNCCIQGAPLNPLALVQSRAGSDHQVKRPLLDGGAQIF
ncbi:MAG: hypothetical protein VW684_09845, partial [Betaproteobacteria bacterium]